MGHAGDWSSGCSPCPAPHLAQQLVAHRAAMCCLNPGIGMCVHACAVGVRCWHVHVLDIRGVACACVRERGIRGCLCQVLECACTRTRGTGDACVRTCLRSICVCVYVRYWVCVRAHMHISYCGVHVCRRMRGTAGCMFVSGIVCVCTCVHRRSLDTPHLNQAPRAPGIEGGWT